MRGRWAAGIEPRAFQWVFRGSLAVAERPGGAAPSHRRVRRDEELIWLKHQGFTKIVSVLVEPDPTDEYRERGLATAHFPLRDDGRHREVIAALYEDLHRGVEANHPTLLHADEVSDRLLGLVAGYLVWSQRVPSVPPALALVERLFRRSVGPDGRSILFELPGRAGEAGE